MPFVVDEFGNVVKAPVRSVVPYVHPVESAGNGAWETIKRFAPKYEPGRLGSYLAEKVPEITSRFAGKGAEIAGRGAPSVAGGLAVAHGAIKGVDTAIGSRSLGEGAKSFADTVTGDLNPFNYAGSGRYAGGGEDIARGAGIGVARLLGHDADMSPAAEAKIINDRARYEAQKKSDSIAKRNDAKQEAQDKTETVLAKKRDAQQGSLFKETLALYKPGAEIVHPKTGMILKKSDNGDWEHVGFSGNAGNTQSMQRQSGNDVSGYVTVEEGADKGKTYVVPGNGQKRETSTALAEKIRSSRNPQELLAGLLNEYTPMITAGSNRANQTEIAKLNTRNETELAKAVIEGNAKEQAALRSRYQKQDVFNDMGMKTGQKWIDTWTGQEAEPRMPQVMIDDKTGKFFHNGKEITRDDAKRLMGGAK